MRAWVNSGGVPRRHVSLHSSQQFQFKRCPRPKLVGGVLSYVRQHRQRPFPKGRFVMQTDTSTHTNHSLRCKSAARPVTFISTLYSTKPRITLASKSTARTIEAWVAAACVGFDWDAGSSYGAIILERVSARSIPSCHVSRKVFPSVLQALTRLRGTESTADPSSFAVTRATMRCILWIFFTFEDHRRPQATICQSAFTAQVIKFHRCSP